MPLAWPPKRVHLYTVCRDHSWNVWVCIKGCLGYRHKELDTDTPQGQCEISSWQGAIYVSVISFHNIVIHVTLGRVNRNGLTPV
jgi:hypothetical protein